MENVSVCEGCGAEIIWIVTRKGKRMPCDPKKKMFITTKGSVYQGFETHWGACPERDKFRKEK